MGKQIETRMQGMVKAVDEPQCPDCGNKERTKMNFYDDGILDPDLTSDLRKTECYLKARCEVCGKAFYMVYRATLIGVKPY